MSDALIEEEPEIPEIETITTPEQMLVVIDALKDDAKYRVQITSRDAADTASLFVSERLGPAIERVEQLFKDPKKKAFDAHKAVVAAEKKLLEPLQALKKTINDALSAWHAKVRAEERARAAELAAEQRRIAQEQQKATAKALEDAGQKEAAQQVREQPVIVPAAPVSVATAPLAASTFIETWEGECTDIKALAAAVAAGTVPESALMVNQTLLNQQARTLKASFRWPGCRAFPRERVRSK